MSRSGALPVGHLRQIGGVGLASKMAAGVVVAASVVTSASDVHLAGTVRRYAEGDDDLEALNNADIFNRLASLANVLLLLVAGVLFIVWLWRARANAEFFCDAPHRRSRGWIIAGWFVPVVGFWFPVQVVDDVVRASSQYVPPRDGALQAAPPAMVVRRWWASYLAMNLTGLWGSMQQSNGLAASSATAATSALDTGAALSMVSTVLAVVSAIFLSKVIELVDDLQTLRPPIPWWQAPTPPAW